MAFTKVNPKIVDFGDGEIGAVIDTLPIKSGQTYKTGQLMILSAGEVAAAADDDIPTHIALTDVDTAVTAGTLVDFARLKVGMHLEMYCTSTGTDTAVGRSNVGVAYDYEVTSNVGTVEIGATADGVFKVVKLACDYEPERNALTDAPGKCIVEVMKVG